MTKTFPQQLSGKGFVALVQEEIDKRNNTLSRVTLAGLSRASGLSETYLRGLIAHSDPNPSVLAMRAVLFTLGFSIEKPEEDVIPMLKRKGVFDPLVHRAVKQDGSSIEAALGVSGQTK